MTGFGGNGSFFLPHARTKKNGHGFSVGRNPRKRFELRMHRLAECGRLLSRQCCSYQGEHRTSTKKKYARKLNCGKKKEEKKTLNNLMVLPKHTLTLRQLHAGWLLVLPHSDIAFDWIRFPWSAVRRRLAQSDLQIEHLRE